MGIYDFLMIFIFDTTTPLHKKQTYTLKGYHENCS